jgi:hypothetical protein
VSSAPDILDNIGRAWNRDPASVARGTERTGVSAALWSDSTDELVEVCPEPDATKHIVVLQFRALRRSGSSTDGRSSAVLLESGT